MAVMQDIITFGLIVKEVKGGLDAQRQHRLDHWVLFRGSGGNLHVLVDWIRVSRKVRCKALGRLC